MPTDRAQSEKQRPSKASTGRRIGCAVLVLLTLAGLFVAGKTWLADHPQHDPFAPLHLSHAHGWATPMKFAALRTDPEQCRAVMRASEIPFAERAPAGEGACRRTDRVVLEENAAVPAHAESTCAVAAGFSQWQAQVVAPAARTILGSDLASIEHLGTYACRRLYGRSDGTWSQHATANAIDISAFVLEDGRRITVLNSWPNDGSDAQFLRAVRDGACARFSTVLSPDYNAAHANHFHLDQQDRGWGAMCR